ncbi:MAG TPA: RsbRD N-terminal domain-containing protein [Thermodesulfovibrionales bacterium]|nr:RsbRD N-terminal domain-containing protein [Thermodesulfovibrionales bacterium]
MDLKDLLLKRREEILERWFEIALGSYASEVTSFLKDTKKQFTNPVGHTISQGLAGILDGLLRELPEDQFSPLLDGIIRIRAVQDLAPSKALAFMLDLKKVIREIAEEERLGVSEELLTLESRIDLLTLIAFDIYVTCREKIYELKANEARNMTYRLLQRAKLVREVNEQ